MGNRRIGTRRLEGALDNLLGHARLGGLNGSPFAIKNPDRIYLEEYFAQRPCINADMASATEATREVANKHFEVLGTNISSDDVTFATTTAGILLTPDGANGDQVIVLPHLDTNQSAWTGTKWGTENQVQWECAIRTDADDIDDTTIWAGLKLTNVPVMATDANQAYFIYGAEDDDAGALTTNANLHFVYSVANTDYVTDLGITVAAATDYRLGIQIDSDRKVSAWVNGVQYGLTTTADADGVEVSPASGDESSLSVALTDDIDLIPYVGIMNQAGTARDMVLYYEKISRIFFE
jgi:hypothetical protein